MTETNKTIITRNAYAYPWNIKDGKVDPDNYDGIFFHTLGTIEDDADYINLGAITVEVPTSIPAREVTEQQLHALDLKERKLRADHVLSLERIARQRESLTCLTCDS